MNSKSIDAKLYQALQIDDAPSAELISNVKLNVPQPTARKDPTRHNIRRFAIIAVAAILTLSLATVAFAYSDVIIQFMFGDSRVTKVESNDGNVGTGFEIINGSDVVNYRNSVDYKNGDYHNFEFVSFPTFEEACQAAPFDLKKPSFIPNGFTLEHATVIRLEDNTYGYDVEFFYADKERLGGSPYLIFWQFYAGPDAHADVKTIDNPEKVMVGEIEASVVRDDGYYRLLCWMKNDIYFELFSTTHDLETLIKIAESVE